jgi:hypothetical protein
MAYAYKPKLLRLVTRSNMDILENVIWPMISWEMAAPSGILK